MHPPCRIDRGARLHLIAPVASHDRVASGQQFAWLTTRDDAAFRVNNLDFEMRMDPLSPIRFPCSPEWWRSNEALQAEAQAPQAPREQRHQAAGNIPALRSSGLFSAGARFSTASHMPVDTAQWRPSDSTSTSRSSRSVRAM